MFDNTEKHTYKKIISQNGLAEFKSLIEKWEILSQNLSDKPSGVPIILPDLFLVSRSGTGRTHVMKLLAEYLSEKPNLMSFYGDVKYFEFMLNYCAPHEYFSEIQRLMTEVNNAAGFRSEYRGIIYIDVDEWREHFEEKHFISFMEYLSDNSDDWLVVLSVSDDKPEQIRKMEALILSYIRIERITLEPPTVDELMKYAARLLGAYGFSLTAQAESILAESIGELCGNKYFDGYKTIKMLCEDIAYSLYISGFRKNKEIKTEDLTKFRKDSEYIRRMIVKIEAIRKIGF